MTTFHDMGLPLPLLNSLDHLKFTHPTPIQEQTVLPALDGRDILGSAQTGTGKTLAFTIPALAHLLANPKGMVLVLTPTRELAQQVAATIKSLTSKEVPFNVALLIGGEHIGKQFRQLKAYPRIIVGTPGRVIDHMERKTLKSDRFSFLILDETDRMFDMGFGIQLEEIISQLPEARQTLMFSATFPAKIEKLAVTYMNDPVRYFTTEAISVSEKLVQETIHVKETEKYGELVNQLNSREGSIIVFVKTKINADRLATQLTKENHSASAIHGDLRQQKRERVMLAFRQGRYRIMVATDIAARGLDVPHVQHVINYDLPQMSEDFIHRIGRTARNGADGAAVTFVSTRDRRLWDDIQRLMNPDAFSSSKSGKGGEGKPSNRNSGKSSSKPRRFAGAKKFEGGRKPDREEGPRDSFWKSERANPAKKKFEGERRSDREEGPRDSFWKSERSNPVKKKFEGERRSDRPEGSRDSFWKSERSHPVKKKFEGERRSDRPEGSKDSFWNSERANPVKKKFEGERRSDRPEGSRDSFSKLGAGKFGPKKSAGSFEKKSSAPRSSVKKEGRTFAKKAR